MALKTDRPQAYQQGWVEFYKLKFAVNEDVLIPRPETELLVDEVLHFAKNKKDLTILDLGTGAGAIAISLAVNLAKNTGHKIIVSEVSEKALEMAKKNAQLHGVTDIQFVVSDLLDQIEQEPDVIVTNLPYIPSERIAYLDSSVKDFEPHVALDGGEDGFALYRKLFQQIVAKGWHPRLLVGEIDYTHGELAQFEAQNYFPQAYVEVKLDLYHRQRILLVKLDEAGKHNEGQQ